MVVFSMFVVHYKSCPSSGSNQNLFGKRSIVDHERMVSIITAWGVRVILQLMYLCNRVTYL